jgi:hypothetical protein
MTEQIIARFSHDRLPELWALMRTTGESPEAMRAAVEKEFAAGVICFEGVVSLDDRPHEFVSVLLDTASIGYWRPSGWPENAVTALCKIVEPVATATDWTRGALIRCAA